MIELIRTYSGYPRAEGRIKQYFAPMYRCTNCETIKPTFTELKGHYCEFSTKKTVQQKNRT